MRMKHFLTLQLSIIFLLSLFDGSFLDALRRGERRCLHNGQRDLDPFLTDMPIFNLHKCAFQNVGIFNGLEAEPHSRPYMAYIKIENSYYCGGVLIKPDWVLTAAHCVMNLPEKVFLGAHRTDLKENGRQMRKIKRTIPHECFKPETFDYDVALLKLNKSVQLTKTVNILALPENCDEPVQGTVCEVAGWGSTTNQNNQGSDRLMEANVTILDRESCSKNREEKYNITKNMICTSEKTKTEACKGDSGGPLICNGVLRGIISDGEDECGVPGNAAIYAFLNEEIICWIYKQLSGLP